MTQGKQRVGMPATVSLPEVRAAVPAARAASAAERTGLPSCEAALQSVIGLAAATLPEPAPGSHAPPAGSSTRVANPQQRLARALQDLDPEVALKVRTLMLAGRDGQALHSVNVNLTLGAGSAAFEAVAHDASENGPLLAEYLRRGHALACASGLDLEGPIAGWAPANPNLDERAWASFGRQLARSEPEDWQCVLYAAAGSRQVSRLYLRLGDHAWWSFQALLDRPSPAAMAKQKRALGRSRSKAVNTRSLRAIAPQLLAVEGRALRRAARAIRARVGALSEST